MSSFFKIKWVGGLQGYSCGSVSDNTVEDNGVLLKNIGYDCMQIFIFI